MEREAKHKREALKNTNICQSGSHLQKKKTNGGRSGVGGANVRMLGRQVQDAKPGGKSREVCHATQEEALLNSVAEAWPRVSFHRLFRDSAQSRLGTWKAFPLLGAEVSMRWISYL